MAKSRPIGSCCWCR